MADRIQIRRDSASNWSSSNPTLAQGELGVELDTSKFKVGDGTTAWNSLGYVINTGSYLETSDIGVTVQGYDADTAKYDDVTANFTGTLQNGGSNVVVATNIGATVLAYDSNLQGFVDAFTLPTTDGSTDQVLKTDGSGNIGFTTVSSGISTGKAIAMAIVFG